MTPSTTPARQNDPRLTEAVTALGEWVGKLYKEVVQGQPVTVFVDHSNLWHSILRVRSQVGYKYAVDYGKLLNKLVRDRFLVNAFFYYSEHDGADPAQRDGRTKLHSYLESVGFTLVRTRLVQGRDGTMREKGLDTAIVKDMVNYARDVPRCQSFILVSGDGDYSETVVELRQKFAVKVEVAFFGQETSRALRQAAFSYTDLDPLRHEFQMA